jgi:teichuronic acid exporter
LEGFRLQASLQDRSRRGIMWSASERYAVQGVHFILGIILARLLLPTDYGLVGMLTIFIALSQTFVDSGFSSALIQKNDCTETDYSTVFFFNIIIGILFYGILFISAPYIEEFYRAEGLSSLIKVLGITVIISSFSMVHVSKLTIMIDFKTQAKASFISVVVGGVLGVLLAFLGFGVWALVIQALAITTFNTLLLWYFCRWMPLASFSTSSFKSLFFFGSKLLATNLLNTFFKNIYIVIIGRAFSVQDLGYYTRAQQFQKMPSENITKILQRVTFPIMSSIKNDDERLYRATRQFIKLSLFVVLPLMVGLVVLSEPLIGLLLTEKWLPAAPLLQLLCFTGVFYPINSININVMIVKGLPGLVFRLELIKKSLIIISIILTFPYGIKAMIIGQIITSIFAFFINTHYTGKLLKYNWWAQFRDIAPSILITTVMALFVWLSGQMMTSDFGKLIVGVITGFTTYIIIAQIFKLEELNKLKEMILQK